ncbi:MAG: hypothetical protein KTR16_03840 [Acidiferrobacterales bacterium]|nr:hypothetical protein [Acidiferrobacterales bacterium]
MVDLEILSVFETETLEVLDELNRASSTKEAILALNTICRSSRLIDLPMLGESAHRLSKVFEENEELNRQEIENFMVEARSHINGAIERAKLVTLEPKRKSAWWKFWQ